MCFNCRLSALIWGYLHPNQVNGVGITTVLHMCLPLVKGPKVMGQLASQLFHGQVCVIPSLSQLQWADKRSRVHFKCAFAFELLLSTVKMRSKELSLSVKQAIIRLKKQTNHQRDSKNIRRGQNNCLEILKKKERTGELSNTKRTPEDHGKQLWWMTEEFFPWWRKHPHNSWPDQETLQEVVYVCQSQQSREDFTRVNTEGSPQDVNHWWASKTGRPD